MIINDNGKIKDVELCDKCYANLRLLSLGFYSTKEKYKEWKGIIQGLNKKGIKILGV